MYNEDLKYFIREYDDDCKVFVVDEAAMNMLLLEKPNFQN